MQIIKVLSEKIDSELEDANKYINCAYKVKEEYPELANLYYKLSLEEMKHMSLLHDEVVKIINNYKATKAVPEGMQVLYDYLHEKHIKWASKIKVKQDNFK